MPPVLLLYDPDASRRETLVNEFRRRGVQIELSYSLEKTQHFLAKNRTDAVILLLPQSRRQEVQSLQEEHRIHPLAFRDDLIDPALGPTALGEVFSLLDALKATLRRAQGASSLPVDKSELVLIGSSTGGFPVAQELLDQFQIEKTTIVLCQHINEGMSHELTQTLKQRVRATVEMVSTQTELCPGKVYLLAGGSDFELKEKYGKLFLIPCQDSESPFHPSFNRLTESLLNLKGTKSSCIILSGLGNDGSRHLKHLRQQGVTIVAQEPSTAVAPGMPRSAIQTGAVHHILPTVGIRNFLARVAA